MTILPKAIYRLHAVPVKIIMTFLAEIKNDPNFHMKSPGTLSSQTGLKKNKVGELTFPNFKTYYEAIIDFKSNQTVWYQHMDKHTDQQNRK